MLTVALYAALSLARAATWDCAHDNPVAPNDVRTLVIQGTRRAPTAARVADRLTGRVIAENRQLQPRPNYQGGYWLQTEGLDAWWIADQGGARFVLLVPHGVLGSQFTAQEHENFAVGGSLQNQFSCVQR